MPRSDEDKALIKNLQQFKNTIRRGYWRNFLRKRGEKGRTGHLAEKDGTQKALTKGMTLQESGRPKCALMKRTT